MIKAATMALLLIQSGQYPKMVGYWYVTREINEEGEQLCAAIAEYTGPDLGFVLFDDRFRLALTDDSWALPLMEYYTVSVSVDERYRRELTAQVLSPTTIVVELGFSGDITTYDEYDALSRGYILRISSARSNFSFDLVGTSEALSELRNCMGRAAQNPFVSEESQNPFSEGHHTKLNTETSEDFLSLRDQLSIAQNQIRLINPFYGENFSVNIDGDLLALTSDHLVGILDVFPATLTTAEDFLVYDASNLALLNTQCERYASIDGTRFAEGLTSIRHIYCNDLEMLSLFWCDEIDNACFSANLVVVEDENSLAAAPSVSTVVEDWSERINAVRQRGER